MGRNVGAGAPALPPDSLAAGQAHEARGDYSAALVCYAAALAAAPTPLAAALAHMNRGNALQKLAATATSSASREREQERVDATTAAVAAYDSALALLSALPFADQPALRNSLGAAWLNRGHALLDHDLPAAIASFTHAIATLSPLPLEENIFHRRNLAGAHTNLAHALLATAPLDSLAHAQAALALLARHARTHSDFAALSLRARRALVMAIGANATPAQLSLATDAVDDGLALACHWESRGFTALRALAARLFRLGAQLYRTHQPHFLAEFLQEHLSAPAFAADLELHTTATAAVTAALAELNSRQLLLAGTVETQRLLATVHALRAMHADLATRR